MALPPTAVPPIMAPCASPCGDGVVDVLGAEVTVALLACLDATSLARCAAVSRSWRRLATDDTLWLPLCRSLWRSKAYVPRRFKALLDEPPKRAATATRVPSRSPTAAAPVRAGDGAGGRSLENKAEAVADIETQPHPTTERDSNADSNNSEVSEPFSWAAMYRQSLSEGAREGILAEELCSVTWSFRFKHMDLPWIRNHPFWVNLPPLLRRFHADGSVASGTRNDPIFGSHENIWRFVPHSISPGPPAAPSAAAAAPASSSGDGTRSSEGGAGGNGGQGGGEGESSVQERAAGEARPGLGGMGVAWAIGGGGAYSTCATGAPTAQSAAAAAAAAAPVAAMRVRINHWPALTVVRRADWGWDMANEYVIYCSLPPSP
ncbi:unnamed protein product [Closterium sp. Yama58-4]|nr:unnamed protein product [Closterium sp. Yama58-4]